MSAPIDTSLDILLSDPAYRDRLQQKHTADQLDAVRLGGALVPRPDPQDSAPPLHQLARQQRAQGVVARMDVGQQAGPDAVQTRVESFERTADVTGKAPVGLSADERRKRLIALQGNERLLSFFEQHPEASMLAADDRGFVEASANVLQWTVDRATRPGIGFHKDPLRSDRAELGAELLYADGFGRGTVSPQDLAQMAIEAKRIDAEIAKLPPDARWSDGATGKLDVVLESLGAMANTSYWTPLKEGARATRDVTPFALIGGAAVGAVAFGAPSGGVGAIPGAGIGATTAWMAIAPKAFYLGTIRSMNRRASGQHYMDLIARGEDPNDPATRYAAMAYGVVDTAIEIGTLGIAWQTLGKRAFTGMAPNLASSMSVHALDYFKNPTRLAQAASWIADLTANATVEGMEEFYQSVFDNAVSTTVLRTGQGVSFHDTMDEVFSQVPENAAQGAAEGGIVFLSMMMSGGLFAPLAAYRINKDAQQQAQDQEFFDAWANAEDTSTLIKRSPRLAGEFLGMATDGTHRDTVFVDPNILLDALNSEDIPRAEANEVMPNISQRIQDAVENGQRVAIPAREFASVVSNSKLMPHIRPHIASTMNGLTNDQRAEQQQVMMTAVGLGDMAKEKDSVLALNIMLDESAGQVGMQVAAELEKTGFRDKATAELEAMEVRDRVRALAANVSASQGRLITPEEAFALYPLNVLSKEQVAAVHSAISAAQNDVLASDNASLDEAVISAVEEGDAVVAPGEEPAQSVDTDSVESDVFDQSKTDLPKVRSAAIQFVDPKTGKLRVIESPMHFMARENLAKELGVSIRDLGWMRDLKVHDGFTEHDGSFIGSIEAHAKYFGPPPEGTEIYGETRLHFPETLDPEYRKTLGKTTEVLDQKAVLTPEQKEERRIESVRVRVPGIAKILTWLLPAERKRVTMATAQKLVDQFSAMPPTSELTAAALAGLAKRGWYRRSAAAIVDIFGVTDAPRFTALLAAFSPRTSVEGNAMNALTIWKNWIKEGRPTDEAKLMDLFARSVQGLRGEDSVLGAWIPNGLLSLTTEDPLGVQLSGEKVDSFMGNLRENVNRVTIDAWEGLVLGIPDPNAIGRVPTYLAGSAAIRKAAAALTKLTGIPWTPEEVQETTWAWAKALVEKAAQAGETRTITEIVQQEALTDAEIGDTPDFANLFAGGVYGRLIEEAGLDATAGIAHRRDGGDGRGTTAEGLGLARDSFKNALVRAARRVERTQRERRVLVAESKRIKAERNKQRVFERTAEFVGLLRSDRVTDEGLSRAYARDDRSGAEGARLLKPTKESRQLLKDWDADTTTAYRESGAEDFHAAISAAKVANEWGASVELKPITDYQAEGVKLFVAKDGLSGIAVKPDGDIVSAFSSAGGRRSYGMMLLAIQEGGTKLDCFDTALPKIYSQFGFVATSRLDWNESLKPEGWDKERFKDYNDGAPDVVLMKLDPANAHPYVKGEGPKVATWDEAAALQTEQVDILESPPKATEPSVADMLREAADKRLNAAAIRVGDRVFQGVKHEQAYDAALQMGVFKDITPFRSIHEIGHLGETPDNPDPVARFIEQASERLYVEEGFLTEGRTFVEREEAAQRFGIGVADRQAFDVDSKEVKTDTPMIRSAAMQYVDLRTNEERVFEGRIHMAAMVAARKAFDVDARNANGTKRWYEKDGFTLTDGTFLDREQAYSRVYTKKWDQARDRAETYTDFDYTTRDEFRNALGKDNIDWKPKQRTKPAWQEGVPQESAGRVESAGPRAKIALMEREAYVALLSAEDLTGFQHELAHWYLQQMVVFRRLGLATEQMNKDLDYITQWAGARTWTELTRPMVDAVFQGKADKPHERFSRGFEVFLAEGHAPTAEMQGIFYRFRNWVRAAYGGIRGTREAMGLELNDEIRQVYDRLFLIEGVVDEVAGDIAEPLFSTRPEGFTDAQWERYQQLWVRHKNAALTRVTQRFLPLAKRRMSEQRAQAIEMFRAEAEAAVAADPGWHAIEFLKRDPNGLGLDREGLTHLLGTQAPGLIEALNGRPNQGTGRKLVVNDGLDPQWAADSLGFRSAGDMVESILQARTVEQRIQERVNREIEGNDQWSEDAVHEEAVAAAGADREGLALVELQHLRSMAEGPLQDAARVAQAATGAPTAESAQADLGLAETALSDALAAKASPEAVANLQALVLNARAQKDAAAQGRREARVASQTLQGVEARLRAGILRQRAQQLVDDVPAGNLKRERAAWASTGTKATRAARAAIAARKFQDAAVEIERQMVADYAIAALNRAQDDVESGWKLLQRLQRGKALDRLRAPGFDGAAQIVKLMGRYDLTPTRPGQPAGQSLLGAKLQRLIVASQRASGIETLQEFQRQAEQQNLETLSVPQWLLNAEADSRHWTKLPLSEFLGVVDTIRNIERASRQEVTDIRTKERVGIEQAVGEIEARVLSVNDERNRGKSSRPSPLSIQGIRDMVRWADSMLLRVSDWIDFAGGDDIENNSLRKYVFDPIDQGEQDYLDMSNEFTRPWTRALQKLDWRRMDREVELQGVMNPATPTQVRLYEVLMWALHTGTESNLYRRNEGYAQNEILSGWTPEVMDKAIKTYLTAEDMSVVQEIWDAFGGLRDRVFQHEFEETGNRPVALESREYLAHTGQVMKGGYMPAKYDSRFSKRAAAFNDKADVEGLFGANYVKTEVEHGHVKSRVEGYSAPLDTNIGVIARHLDSVLYDLALRRPVRDAYKVVTHPRFQSVIEKTWGNEYNGALRKMVHDAARVREMRPSGGWRKAEQLNSFARSSVVYSGLGYRISTGLIQITGLAPGFAEVGPTYMARALAHSVERGVWGLVKDVREVSRVLQHRAVTKDRELREFLTKHRDPDSIKARIDANICVLITISDSIVSSIVWDAQRIKSMEEHGDMARAIREADRSIDRTQGSHTIASASQLMRAEGFARWITLFGSFTSNVYARERRVARLAVGLQATEDVAGQPVRRAMPAAAAWMLLCTAFIPATLDAMIRGEAPPEDEEGKKHWATWALKRFVSFLASPVPGVSQVVDSILFPEQRTYLGRNPTARLFELPVRAVDELSKVFNEDEQFDPEKLTLLALQGLTMAKVAPLSQAEIWVDNFWPGEEMGSPRDLIWRKPKDRRE